jgi:hypothetical protein
LNGLDECIVVTRWVFRYGTGGQRIPERFTLQVLVDQGKEMKGIRKGQLSQMNCCQVHRGLLDQTLSSEASITPIPSGNTLPHLEQPREKRVALNEMLMSKPKFEQ